MSVRCLVLREGKGEGKKCERGGEGRGEGRKGMKREREGGDGVGGEGDREGREKGKRKEGGRE